ncbi:MAG TPA: YciI family protein [Bacteroidales bacterium]|nr:YciI family protein [Bacteroidales bacterium]
MQFLLIAYDGNDAEALERRMKVRVEHLEKIEVLKNKGECLAGGAILDDSGKMVGSMIIYEFPDRTTLDEKLKDEPYFTNGVWQKIEIKPFRLAIIKK